MSNGRVTNAQLATKIDRLTENVQQYKLAQEARVVYLETVLEIMKDDVDTLKKRDYIVGGVTGILAAIAGIIGLQN